MYIYDSVQISLRYSQQTFDFINWQDSYSLKVNRVADVSVSRWNCNALEKFTETRSAMHAVTL